MGQSIFKTHFKSAAEKIMYYRSTTLSVVQHAKSQYQSWQLDSNLGKTFDNCSLITASAGPQTRLSFRVGHVNNRCNAALIVDIAQYCISSKGPRLTSNNDVQGASMDSASMCCITSNYSLHISTFSRSSHKEGHTILRKCISQPIIRSRCVIKHL